MTVLFSWLLVLAAFTWFILIAAARDMNRSDAAGNGLAMVYAVFFAIGLWVLLAILVIVSAVKGEIPGLWRACAFLGVPLSGASALLAINLLSDRDLPRWPMVVLIAIPPLVAAYSAWAYLPSVRAAAAGIPVSIAIWGAVAVLALAPCILMANREEAAARGRIANQRKLIAYAEQEHKARLAEFQALPDGSELRTWLSWAEPEDKLREQALHRARESASRQAEAEELIRIGLVPAMRELPNLDLQPTAKLCSNARAFLSYRAEILRRRGPDRPSDVFAGDIEPFIPAIRWLLDQGCDCRAELSEIDTAVRMYRRSPERERLLSTLARLRVPR